MKISSIIIAKNEEANIRRCIQSQLSCIDEIIILIDSCSTDKTFDIAKSYAAVKVMQVKWQGYAETKRYGISLASNNWIFWIDADEEITTDLSEEINAFKKSEPAFNAYSVPRKAYFLGKWIKHSGWYPGRVARLFNKNEVSFDNRKVHEQLIVKDAVGKLINNLNHYTDPSIHHYLEKSNRYTSLASEELFFKRKKILDRRYNHSSNRNIYKDVYLESRIS